MLQDNLILVSMLYLLSCHHLQSSLIVAQVLISVLSSLLLSHLMLSALALRLPLFLLSLLLLRSNAMRPRMTAHPSALCVHHDFLVDDHGPGHALEQWGPEDL